MRWSGLGLVGVLGGAVAGAVSGQGAFQFTEEALARGVDEVLVRGFDEISFGVGIAFADLDGDGDPDLVTIGAHDGRIGLYENDGAGFFTDRAAQSGVPLIFAPSGIAPADYDGDGDLDLYVTQSLAANLLLRNEGGFHFSDVALAAGVADLGAGMGCAWADIEGDGDLDVYLANRTQTSNDTTPNRLYRNLGNGTFVDVAPALGVVFGDDPTFQPIFFDMEGDGDPDLYLSTDKGYAGYQNHLLTNAGGVFTDITDASGTGAFYNSMGVAVGDFDGNGLFDLYPTNTPEGTSLYLQTSPGIFAETAAAAGVVSYAFGWGALFLDLDNNGVRELFVCDYDAPDRLYAHDGTWPAVDVAVQAGLGAPGPSFGVAAGDIEGDGDLDLAISEGFAPVQLYVNGSGPAHTWIRLCVIGTGANPFAVGAGVAVRVGSAWQVDQVLLGMSYKSQSDLVLAFGLDKALRADEVRVLWRTGELRSFLGLRAGETWRLLPDALLGDADEDGDIDWRDVEALVDCWTGPVPGALEPGCEACDLERDADVDLEDLRRLLQRSTLLADIQHVPGAAPIVTPLHR